MNAFQVGETDYVYCNFRLSDMDTFVMEPAFHRRKAYMKIARKYGFPEDLCQKLGYKTTGDYHMDMKFAECKMQLKDFIMYCELYIQHCQEYDSDESDEDRQEFHTEHRMEHKRAKWTQVQNGPW